MLCRIREVRYGLDSNDPSDASSDKDNDGVSAYDEFIAGTIPSGSLYLDGNGQYDALTDGLLLLRESQVATTTITATIITSISLIVSEQSFLCRSC